MLVFVTPRIRFYYSLTYFVSGDMLGNNLAALKAFMPLIGLDLGPARSPMRAPTDAELNSLRDELKEIGFFEWSNK